MPRFISGSAGLLATATFVCSPALGAGRITYGSKGWQQVSVVSRSGLDTSHAVIRTKHTRADAVAACRASVGKVTPACIQQQPDVPLKDVITANCLTGEFTDFQGNRYRFAGPSPDRNGMAKYRLISLPSGEVANGSTASGYSTNMGIFKALCPRRAPADAE